ncbi:hypothetical protein JCM3765_005904 [Sporobolomyces pararoseus]
MGDRFVCLCVSMGCLANYQGGNPSIRSKKVCNDHIKKDKEYLDRRRKQTPNWNPRTTEEAASLERLDWTSLPRAPAASTSPEEVSPPGPDPESNEQPQEDLAATEYGMDTNEYENTFDYSFGGGGGEEEEVLHDFRFDLGEDQPPDKSAVGADEGDRNDTNEVDEVSSDEDDEDEDDSSELPIVSAVRKLRLDSSPLLSPNGSPLPSRSPSRLLRVPHKPAHSEEEEEEEEEERRESSADSDEEDIPVPMAQDQIAHVSPPCLLELSHTPEYTPPNSEDPPLDPPADLRPLDPFTVDSLRVYWISHRSRDTVSSHRAHAQHISDRLYDGNPLLSISACDKLLEELTGVLPQAFDACPRGCRAYTGPFANDERCGAKVMLEKLDEFGNPVLKPGGEKVRELRICNEPRWKDSNAKNKKSRHHCIFFDPVPFFRALFENPETRELMEYFQRELRTTRAEFGDNFDYKTQQRPIHDIPHGKVAVVLADFILEDEKDGRRTMVAITFDGAEIPGKNKKNVWVWALQIFNIPPNQGRYQSRYFFPLLLSFGDLNPKDLDSFTRIIYERLFDAYEGFWMWDGKEKEWFVWKAGLLCCLADLQAQKKDAGGKWSAGIYGCPNCSQRSLTDRNGRGRWYARGPAEWYKSEETTGRGTTRFVNEEGNEKGYSTTWGGNPAEIITNEEYFRRLKHIEDTQGVKAKERLYTAYGISHVPLVASYPLFDRQWMHPPDYAHLLSNNAGLFLLKTWLDEEENTAIFAEIEQIMKTARMSWPSSFGTFPRDPADFVTTSPRLYELDLWISLFSIPCFHALGFDKDRLDHWSKFVELYKIVSRPGERTVEDAIRVEKLAEEFNDGIESLYVKFSLDKIHSFPLAIHRLLHLAHWMILLGNLAHYSQLPLERFMGLVKAAAERSPQNPFETMVHVVTVRLRFLVARLKHPEAFTEIMKDLQLSKQTTPRAPFELGSRLAQKHVKNSASSETHFDAFRRFLSLKTHSTSFDDLNDTISRYPTFGTVTLQDGSLLSSTLREETKLAHSKRHHLSWFLTTRIDQDGKPSTCSLTLGRAIGFFAFPTDPSSAERKVFATVNLYNSIETLYKGGALKTSLAVRTSSVVPVEAIEENVGVLEVPSKGLLFVLRKRETGVGLSEELEPDEVAAYKE